MKPIFITGTGTDVGKTIISAIVTEALEADYWKPVQAGWEVGTDAGRVRQLVSNDTTVVHPERYRLRMPASPHIAARQEGISLSVNDIVHHIPGTKRPLIIEGAGGLLVPLNETSFMLDLIIALDARVIIVSKHELGSINHSLLTAAVLKQAQVEVVGWIFNEEYLDYGTEIARWSGYPLIASIPHLPSIDARMVRREALRIQPALQQQNL